MPFWKNKTDDMICCSKNVNAIEVHDELQKLKLPYDFLVYREYFLDIVIKV